MKFFKQMIVGSVGAAALIASMGAQGGCGATSNGASTGSSVVAGSSTEGSSDANSAPTGPQYTVAQQNAIESAQNYLSMGNGFSRAGLIEQLTSKAGEGFSRRDAVFAVNHVTVNWNQQAVLSAKAYLSMGSGFSRASLIEQLTSSSGEGFTLAQATYAANKVGLR